MKILLKDKILKFTSWFLTCVLILMHSFVWDVQIAAQTPEDELKIKLADNIGTPLITNPFYSKNDAPDTIKNRVQLWLERTTTNSTYLDNQSTIDGQTISTLITEIQNGHSSYTESSPLLIDSRAKLVAFMRVVNASTTYNFSGKFVRLTADINLGGTTPTYATKETTAAVTNVSCHSVTVSGSLSNIWTPIGGNSKSGEFQGTFDGNGYTISNMVCNESGASTDVVGLFGYSWAGMTVRNLNIKNSHLICSPGSTASYAGGIVGKSDCNQTTFIAENCNVECVIFSKGLGARAGGICGEANKFKANNCITRCVIFCWSTNDTSAAYSGGFLGRTAAVDEITITNCRSNCIVGGYQGGENAAVGGFVGGSYNITTSKYLTFKNCTSNCIILAYGDTTYSGGYYGGEIINNTTANLTVRAINCTSNCVINASGGALSDAGGYTSNCRSCVMVNCTSNCLIYARDYGSNNVGGFVGRQRGSTGPLTMINCASRCSLYAIKSTSGDYACAGGFVGTISSNVTATIKNSYAACTMTVTVNGAAATKYAGRLVGDSNANSTPSVSCCYYDSTLTATNGSSTIGSNGGKAISATAYTTSQIQGTSLATVTDSGVSGLYGATSSASLSSATYTDLDDSSTAKSLWYVSSGRYPELRTSSNFVLQPLTSKEEFTTEAHSLTPELSSSIVSLTRSSTQWFRGGTSTSISTADSYALNSANDTNRSIHCKAFYSDCIGSVESIPINIKKILVKPSTALTFSAPAESSVYDGNKKEAEASGGNGSTTITYSYKVRGDTSGTASATAPTSAGDYTVTATQAKTEAYLSTSATRDFSITQKPLTISGITIANKVYDGTTSATISGTPSLSGVISGNDVKVSGSGTATFSNKDVGKGKSVTISNYTLGGTSAGNYSLTQPSGLTADITAKPITISNVTVKNKNYDGRNNAEFSGTPSFTRAASGVNISTDGKICAADSGVAITLTNGAPTFSSVGTPNGQNNVGINFTNFSVNNSNYSVTQPTGVTANILQSFLPVCDTHYTLSGTLGTNGWYTSLVTAKAAAGYKLSTGNLDTSTWSDSITFNKQGSNTHTFYVRRTGTSTESIAENEISRAAAKTLEIDTSPPTGEIKIETNRFTQFLNTITFGLFFKNTVDVEITANESGPSETIKTIDYLKTSTQYNENEILNSSLTWTRLATDKSSGTFSITSEEASGGKFIVYAKITSSSGYVTYINSNGVVLYVDSIVSTKEISHTKFTGDRTADIELKGNTIKEIKLNNDLVLTTESYKCENSKLTFYESFLNKLSAGEHEIKIFFNPMGIVADADLSVVIKLIIQKADQSVINFVNLNDSYTYGDNEIALQTSGGSSSSAPLYYSENTDIAEVTPGNNLKIKKAGSVKIIAEKPEDDDYNAAFTDKQITIMKKTLTIDNVDAKDKIYDGTINSAIKYVGKNEPNLVGVVQGDENGLGVDTSSARAEFDNRTADNPKNVTFNGFVLIGDYAENYQLEQPIPKVANISKREVTISGITVKSRAYNGTQIAEIDSMGHIVQTSANNDDFSAAYFEDLLISDGLTIDDLNVTAVFEQKDVGSGIIVSFDGFALAGENKNNYLLSNPNPVSAAITKAPLEVDVKIEDKFYDGLHSAKFASGYPKLLGGFEDEAINLSLPLPVSSFKTYEIGENIEIEFSDSFTLDGENSINRNYEIPIQPSGVKASILAAFTPEEGTHYTLSQPWSDAGWQAAETGFVITAENGYYLSYESNADSFWSASLTNHNQTSTEGKQVGFYVREIATGVISQQGTVNYRLDKTPPEGHVTVGAHTFNTFMNNITFGYFFKETVEAKVHTSDTPSDIAKEEYFIASEAISENDIKTAELDWQPGNSFTVTPEQKFVAYFKATDNSGNITYFSSDGIVVSAVLPTISVTPNFVPGKWQNSETSALNVDITVPTEMPIIKEIKYTLDNETFEEVSIGDKTRVSFNIQNLPDGDYDAKIIVVSELGDVVTESVNVKKDTKLPIITNVLRNTIEPTQSVTLTIEANDVLSGLSGECCSFDGGIHWQESFMKTYTKNTQILADTLKVKDTAGNIASYPNVINITNIDILKPEIPTISGASDIWQNKSVTLTVEAQDKEPNEESAKSGIAFFEYSIDGGESYTKVDGWKNNKTFAVEDEGDYTGKIMVRVTDYAGNVSDPSDAYTLKIDKTKPTILDVTPDITEFTNNNVSLTVTAEDGLSGLAEQSYSFDGGTTWHSVKTCSFSYNQTITPGTIQVKDNAGNIASFSNEITIDNIDKLKPNKPVILGASNAWQIEPVTLTVICDDGQKTFENANSGIAFFEYSIDGGKSYKKVENFAENKTFTITEDGDYSNLISVKVTDYAGNVSDLSDSYTVKLDKTSPEVKIEILNSNDVLWKKFLNLITFRYFYQNTVSVKITGKDATSGVKSIEYLKAHEPFEDELAVLAVPAADWKTAALSGTDKEKYFEFDIETLAEENDPNEKFVIYAKVIDHAGRTTIVNSNGIVIYRELQIDPEYKSISIARFAVDDKTIFAALNGNSVTDIEIENGGIKTLLSSDSYIQGDGKITLKGEYLKTLSVGSYTLKFFYQALSGTNFGGTDDEDIANYEKYLENWETTPGSGIASITLAVDKAVQTPLSFDNLMTSYTYGDEDIQLQISGGASNINSIVSSSDSSVVEIMNNSKLKIKKVGKVQITVTKPEDDNYIEKSITKEITINPKNVTIIGVDTLEKVYDGTTHAELNNPANWSIYGNIDGNNLVIKAGTANFEDKNARANKEITFTGFELDGPAKENYHLTNQPNTVNKNIFTKKLFVTGVTAENKVYDSSNAANVKLDNAVLNGKIESDDTQLKQSADAEFDSKNVGNNKKVSIPFELIGDDAGNYTFDVSDEDKTYGVQTVVLEIFADITPKNITVDLGNIDKFFDNSDTVFFEKNYPKFIGIFDSDDVKFAVTLPVLTFDALGNSETSTFDIPVIISKDFEITGGDSNNYSLIQPANVKAGILVSFDATLGQEYEITPGFNGDNWYGGSVQEFTVNAINNNSLSTDINGPWSDKLEFAGDKLGGNIAAFYAKDAAGRISKQVTETYYWDNDFPTAEIKIGTNVINNILNTITFGLFFKETVKVECFADDSTSGIYSVEYHIASEHLENSLDISDWTNGSEFSVQPDEKFVAYFRITDNAGNKTIVNSVGTVVSVTQSEIGITPSYNPSDWQNSEIWVDAAVSNNMPVIKKVSYKVLDKEYSILVNSAESKDKPTDSVLNNVIKYDGAKDLVEFKIPYENLPDGDYEVSILTESVFGDEIIRNIRVKKDTVSPLINTVVHSDLEYTNKSVFLTVNAEDEVSGIKEYSFDSGVTWIPENSFEYFENQNILPGSIRVKDFAGNVSSYNQEIKIENIDIVPPKKPSIIGASDMWTNKNIVLTVVSEDEKETNESAKSKIAYFEYSVDGGETYTKVENWFENKTFTISETGDYTNKICVRVTDYAGNTSETSDFYTARINKVLPKIISVRKSTEKWTNQDVELIVEASENGTGQIIYSFDGGQSWQKENVKICSHNQTYVPNQIQIQDLAGNITSFSESIVIDNIDKIAPKTPTVQGMSNLWVRSEVTLHVNAEDEKETENYGKSGIDYFEYSLDGGVSYKKVMWDEAQSFIVSENGDYTDKIFVKLTDKAGNVSDISNAYTVKLMKGAEEFSLVNSETNIRVYAAEGVIPTGSNLIAQEIIKGTQAFSSLLSIVDEVTRKNAKNMKFYDITILDLNGNIIQPNGMITVLMPIPKEYNTDLVKVFRLAEDGEDEEKEGHVIQIDGENYYSFDTDHFSPYALIEYEVPKDYLKPNATENKPVENEPKKEEMNNPKSFNYKMLYLLFIPIAILIIFLIIYLEEKKK